MADLLYDLAQCRSSRRTKNSRDEITKVEYKLPSGEQVVITPVTDSAGRNIGVVVKVNDRVLAKADVIDRGVKNALRIEEVHYAPDGSGKEQYRARSWFSLGRKQEEVPVNGAKVYEFFPEYPF